MLNTSLQESSYRLNVIPGLPWSCGEGVGFGGKGSHRTHIDNVAWKLRHEHLLHICPDLQVVSSSCCSQVFHTSNLTGKTTSNTQRRNEWLSMDVFNALTGRTAMISWLKDWSIKRYIVTDFFDNWLIVPLTSQAKVTGKNIKHLQVRAC